MEHRTVRLTHDHLERQARCSLERAIEEGIWNALDAGGQEVEVDFESDELHACKAIEIRDKGVGIPFGIADKAFGTIGESPKVRERQTREGRSLHGSEGRGRFKVLVLGKRAVWTTRYREKESIWQYQLRIDRNDERTYSLSAPEAVADGDSGTVLRVEDVEDGVEALRTKGVRDGLTVRFALYLKNYPDVTLLYDGAPIEPSSLIMHSRTSSITPPLGQTQAAELEIIEWRVDMGAKKLFICDSRGFAWHEIPAGIHAPGLNLVGYLKCEQAKEWCDVGLLGQAEMNPTISGYIEKAKAELREYRRERQAEEARDVVAQWKKDEIYPFPDEPPRDLIARAERQVFDIVASRVNEFHEPFRTGDTASKKLTLGLVREALENNPTSLRRILESAIGLPKEKQDELAELLEITNLDAIIAASRTVAQRVDIIKGFRHLIFSDDWRKRLLERTQLHRLLVHELWLFGEEYTLDSDDETLREVLQKHIKKLGRPVPAADVAIDGIEDITRIPDLMLSRRFLRGNNDKFEHLVIELKRPTIKIGGEQLQQIEDYADVVAREPIFDKERVRWTFVIVGNDLEGSAERRAQTADAPGCVYTSGNLTIWAKRWNEVFHDAELRYEFFRERLAIEASWGRGLEYLNNNYEHLLTGRGMTKRQEIVAGKLGSMQGEAEMGV